MATSFYVYDTLLDYKKVNKQFIDDVKFHAPLLDVYVEPKKRLIIVTNTNDMKQRIDMSRTIAHARNGTIPNELLGRLKLIKYNNVIFDAKKGKLIFNPRFLRSPLFELKIGRYYGDRNKGKFKIDWGYRFYDFMRDRVNLILISS